MEKYDLMNLLILLLDASDGLKKVREHLDCRPKTKQKVSRINKTLTALNSSIIDLKNLL